MPRVSLMLYTSITVAFYLLGAAILHARGLDVTNVDLVHVLSQMFRQTFGEWAHRRLPGGRVLRAVLDALRRHRGQRAPAGRRLVRLSAGPLPDEEARRRVVRDASIGLSLASTVMFLLWSQPVTLVLIGATAQALMLPFLAFAAVRFQRSRGAGAQASRSRDSSGPASLLSATAMILLGGYQFWDLIF